MYAPGRAAVTPKRVDNPAAAFCALRHCDFFSQCARGLREGRERATAPARRRDISAHAVAEGYSLVCSNTRRLLSATLDDGETLLVFLRHLGCVFCRQMLVDLRLAREAIDSAGIRLLLVHMADDHQAELVLRLYGLQDVQCVRDPDRKLYEVFGLARAQARVGLCAGFLMRGLAAGPGLCSVPAIPRADLRQLAGAFLVGGGRVRAAWVCRRPWERVNFAELIARAGGIPSISAPRKDRD